MNQTVVEPIDISKSKVQMPDKMGRVSNLKRTGRKSSINARRVAENVIRQISKDRSKVSLKKAIIEAGYSKSVSESPKIVTEQAEYKNAMASYEQKLVSLRDKTINALHGKDLSKEKLYDVTGLLKVVDHSTALIQGKSTENVAVKQEVVVFGSDDFLARQIDRGSVRP